MNLSLEEVVLPLDSFNLEINTKLTGRAVGVFGPSGSGKTSLIETITGLRCPSSGSIGIEDRILFDAAKKIQVPVHLRRIGYVPQDLALFPHLNVRQNLAYGRKSGDVSESSKNWNEIVAVMQIEGLLNRDIQFLSGGEKQRVAFARALLATPQLLLLDEPLANLDQALKEDILIHLVKIRDRLRIPMIYVSHSWPEIQSLCDEVLILSEGRLKAQDSPANLVL